MKYQNGDVLTGIYKEGKLINRATKYMAADDKKVED